MFSWRTMSGDGAVAQAEVQGEIAATTCVIGSPVCHSYFLCDKAKSRRAAVLLEHVGRLGGTGPVL